MFDEQEWPAVRRADRLMSTAEASGVLDRGFCARIGTVGPDGWPYIVPVLYALVDGTVVFHHVCEVGHLNRNLRHCPRVCVEVDEPGEVIALGPSAAQTTVTYSSVIAFGVAHEITDVHAKTRMLELLTSRYVESLKSQRQLSQVTIEAVSVYAIELERVTGKRCIRPNTSARSDR